MIDTLNSGLLEIQRLSSTGSTAATYRQIAGAYERLGKQLGAILPKDANLSKALASYRDLTQRAAKHSRAYSEELAKIPDGGTMDAETSARLERIRGAAKSDLTREASLVRKLNALCHP